MGGHPLPCSERMPSLSRPLLPCQVVVRAVPQASNGLGASGYTHSANLNGHKPQARLGPGQLGQLFPWG